MSRDLISRKEAIDALYGSIFCADAIPIIEYLPTAYDVEAVVRELEYGPELIVGDAIFKGTYLKKSQVIEIVKRGGRNE